MRRGAATWVVFPDRVFVCSSRFYHCRASHLRVRGELLSIKRRWRGATFIFFFLFVFLSPFLPTHTTDVSRSSDAIIPVTHTHTNSAGIVSTRWIRHVYRDGEDVLAFNSRTRADDSKPIISLIIYHDARRYGR